ncbi:MAG: type III-B CRISPR module-associated Cmr3 family protein [Methylococcaceae bacterium]
MTEYRFLEPLDVLFLRGNKLFGDPGSFGESLVPPWPSVAAGALRSRILADAGVNLKDFAEGRVNHPQLGTPSQPGSFTVTGFYLARHKNGQYERLMPLPADVVVSETAAQTLEVRYAMPANLAQKGLSSSAPLPLLPVLAEPTRSKAASGYWLSGSGWAQYCAGQPITPETGLIHISKLWSLDARVGVGLESSTRSVAEGRLFSMQAVALKKREHAGSDGYDTGFLLSVEGADVPGDGLLRLGGDGRAVSLHTVHGMTAFPLHHQAVLIEHRCRLVLTTPGLFTAKGQGWLPDGIRRDEAGTYRFDRHGVTARLVAAAIPRAEVISGWDLARWQPKPARKAVPTGSVYWLDELTATEQSLNTLVNNGIWPEPHVSDSRKAEGYNRLMLTPWQGD